MELLNQHRAVIQGTKSVKEREMELMQDMDEQFLLLQNFKYKIQHLQREIQRIDQQETLYSEIDLYPLDQFREMQPEKVVEDQHQLMLNRLEFELEERKRLLLLLAEERERRDDLENAYKDKMNKLEGLKSQIAKVIQSSKDLEKVFAQPDLFQQGSGMGELGSIGS
jgi:THO complex subunit 5